MRSNWIKKLGVVVLVLLDLPLPGFAVPAPMHQLKGHVIQQIQNSVRMGRVPAEESVDLSLVIQLDPALMDQTLQEIYGHPGQQPGHFLSSTEFALKFGLAEKRKRLKDFARANGLTVNATEDRAESMVVNVSGRADVVEKMFNVQLNKYRRPDGQVFRAHETDPMVPETLVPDISAVLGLSNLTGVAYPHLRMGQRPTGAGGATALSIAPEFVGTAPSPAGAVAPRDIKTIYGISQASQDGTGQTVAIFELDGYNPTDIAAYEAQFSLPNVPLTFIGVDGQANLCGAAENQPCNAATLGGGDGGMIEVALDIELVAALVPQATQIYVYDAQNSGSGIVDEYNRIATDNLAHVVSTSWGAPELAFGSFFPMAEAPIFQRMAAQGQAVFAASGDNGAFDNRSSLSVDDPASQPYVTGVGGTTLTGTPSSATETAWSGSGGGVSAVWPIPSYQGGVPGTASQSTRNVPDVSLNADPNSGYAVYVGGSFYGVKIGGTSAASPLWTAFMALVNQNRALLGNSALGFANPTFYQIGTSGALGNFFNDITVGNNGGYLAKSGYDNVTGWGSYRGSTLITGLGSVSDFATLFNLANVYAYPNPWDIRKNAARQITIKNIPGGATVKIFTVSGFLVKTLTGNIDHATWDMTNDSGHTVASGLYLFMVTNNDKKIIGKIAIIK